MGNDVDLRIIINRVLDMSQGSEGEAQKNDMRQASQLRPCARPAKRLRGTPSTLRQLIANTYFTTKDRDEADRRVLLICDQWRARGDMRKFGQGLAKSVKISTNERSTT